MNRQEEPERALVHLGDRLDEPGVSESQSPSDESSLALTGQSANLAEAIYPRSERAKPLPSRLTLKQGLKLFAWSALTYHLIHYGIILTIAAVQSLSSSPEPGGLRCLILSFFLLPLTYSPAYLVIALGSLAAAKYKPERRQ